MALSVLLHGGLVALLVYGWWRFQHRTVSAPAQLALDATVVDGRTLPPAPDSVPPAPEPPPAPAPAASAAAPSEPAPSPDDQAVPMPDAATREQAAQAEAAHDAAVQQEARLKAQQAAAQAEAEQKAQDEAERAEARKAEAERKAQEAARQTRAAKLDAERRAKEHAEQARAEARRKAEEQARTEAQHRAEEAQRQADAATKADLQRSLEAEERVNAARASGAEAGWIQQITASIQRAWHRPPSAHGIDCHLLVTQVPGGEITAVKLGSCNADDATRQSIVDAVYRASPLPPPPDPALFVRDLDVHFNPPD